ncbi:MAG: APC family permease [Dethiobacteria bacterium]
MLPLVTIALGMVIGSGVVGLIGPAIAFTGRSAGLAFAAAVVLGLITVLPGVFISATIRVQGGEYRMVQVLMGKHLSGIYIWNFMVTHVALSMTGLIMGNYIQSIIPSANPSVMALLAVTVFYVINLFGIDVMSKVQNVMVFVLIAALLIFVFWGLGDLSEGAFNLSSPDYFSGGLTGFISAMVLLSSATTSHQLLFGLGGDVAQARNNMPRAIIITSAIIFFIYGAVGFVAANVLPVEEVAGKTLTVVAQKVLPLPVFIFFMIAGPVLAICTTFNGIFPSVARTMQEAAKHGWFPQVMATENRYGAPYWFLTVIYLVAVIPILLGFSVAAAASTMLLVININKIILLIAAYRLPSMYPQLWKTSILNLPNWLYYIIITISGLCQFLILYNSAANLKASIVIVSIAVMAVLSACALLRSKHVKVSFTLKDLE